MSEATEPEEQQIPVPVEWVSGGLPLYLAQGDVEEMIEAVHDQGFQIFYLLGEEKTVTSTKDPKTKVTHKTTKSKPQIFKVIKNLVGSACVPVSDISIGIEAVDTTGYFSLPSIPYSLINDIDDFFREVYRVHQTEAVVIFTYDTKYQDTDNPEDGWGILVPKQTNSSVSCDYDPTSVIEEFPDPEPGEEQTVFQVGTAHSHPGMSAYCSGTDKADQAHFDGIHITFGWKSGSKETEYHIEMQMGGSSYTFKPEQIFTDVPEPVENPKVKVWTEKVTKENLSSLYGGTYTSNNYQSWYSKPAKDRYPGLPDGCPNPDQVTLIVEPLVSSTECTRCPVCDAFMSKFTLQRGRCNQCQAFIVPVDNTLDKVIQEREADKIPCTVLKPEMDPEKSIWVWEESIDEKTGLLKDIIYEKHEGSKSRNMTSKQLNSGKANGGASFLDGSADHLPYLVCADCGEKNAPQENDCHVCGCLAFSIPIEFSLPGPGDDEEEEGIFDDDWYHPGFL